MLNRAENESFGKAHGHIGAAYTWKSILLEGGKDAGARSEAKSWNIV